MNEKAKLIVLSSFKGKKLSDTSFIKNISKELNKSSNDPAFDIKQLMDADCDHLGYLNARLITDPTMKRFYFSKNSNNIYWLSKNGINEYNRIS